VVFFSSIDVAMYIATKAAEALYYYALDKKLVKQQKHGQILMFALSTAALFYGSAYEPHNLRRSYFSWLMKASHGNWAHFFQAFTPVRLESGLTDLASYKEWNFTFAQNLIKQYITPHQMEQLYSEY